MTNTRNRLPKMARAMVKDMRANTANGTILMELGRERLDPNF